jgi:hypothetical protein
MKWTELLLLLVLFWLPAIADFFSWWSPQKSSRMEVWSGRGLFVFELFFALAATAAFLFSVIR